MCNLCIVIITENSTQLHPSNMKLMTISLHEIFMFFLLTIFFYFLFAFLRFRVSRNSQLFSYFTLCLLPCLLHRFDGRKNGQNNFQGSVGRFDVIVNYVQGAASNFFSISDARSWNCSMLLYNQLLAKLVCNLYIFLTNEKGSWDVLESRLKLETDGKHCFQNSH